MSMVEEQAKELGVDAAGGAKDGGQERDIMIVSVGMLILIFGVVLEFVSCFLISCRMLILIDFLDCWWALSGNNAAASENAKPWWCLLLVRERE